MDLKVGRSESRGKPRDHRDRGALAQEGEEK